jgi:hypothetical protein
MRRDPAKQKLARLPAGKAQPHKLPATGRANNGAYLNDEARLREGGLNCFGARSPGSELNARAGDYRVELFEFDLIAVGEPEVAIGVRVGHIKIHGGIINFLNNA